MCNYSPFLLFLFSPCGKKFRSKPQIARFLGDNADLTCFDFSRAGSLGERRRAARDRNPAGTRRMDLKQTPPPPAVRPLSNAPLRPSGPIRRTCGVIKLPVTVVPSLNSTSVKDNSQGSSTSGEQKQATLSLIVQSLWERRLLGVMPHDHSTGRELSRTHSPSPELYHSLPPDLASSHSPRPQPSVPSLLNTSVPSPLSASVTSHHRILPTPPPPSLNHSPANSLMTAAHSHSNLSNVKLLQQPEHQSYSPSSSPQFPVTDSDVLMQERRVMLIRQQLLAAQRVL